ncbi:tRNA (adenosine(37)-N6)-dimethylallyltransferase MiaA [Lacibacter sp.]|uniref:tRNA (adenosine(37)-N6)-dimethylallyltransferase MiaA n=1 Tax=Lacibacter sp. TaxID=1915409 RepID=UPI002B4B4644|nr:tRNA (adenosine(37)-N6)-dimethylallyltransferase MiaA [Lacibacter sp.]HLP36963.1 tRNA (adenosine(37)-N6)-dimethylallyltransferase MiaA [Lacibacter sp.]
MNKTVILIAGPTAVGKTAVAIQLAKYFHTEIISADSRQCFKEISIGVAKPSAEELKEVKHYFINSHTIHDTVTAASYEKYALGAVTEIFQQHDLAVMVGGTGLYIKAFCEGMDEIPAVDETLRNELQQNYLQYGIEWLQQQLQQYDPLFAAKGEMQNPQRMLRALEVVRSTGESILAFRKGEKQQRKFNIIKIGLDLPREKLYNRINHRVDVMMQEGLLQEAKEVYPLRHLNALQTVGYRELFDHFNGNCTLEKAVDKIKQNSRHYAKRQLTWFKRDEAMKWFHPSQLPEIIEHVSQQIKNGQSMNDARS